MDNNILNGLRKRLEDILPEFSTALNHNLRGIIDESISINTEKVLDRDRTPPHISLDFMLHNRNTDIYLRDYEQIKEKVVETAKIYRLFVEEGCYPGRFSPERYETGNNGYMPIIGAPNRNMFLMFGIEME